MFGRKKDVQEVAPANGENAPRQSSDRTLANHNTAARKEGIDSQPTKAQIKRATRPLYYWALFSSFCNLVSVVFLILVELGDTAVGSFYNSTYFLQINIANIIPVSVPNAVLINTVAQSLGLHDFYSVGLWSYCEGYEGVGYTQCSDPRTLYWFNPVEVIESQLLAGATSKTHKVNISKRTHANECTVALPAEVTSILKLIRIVSHLMFGFFLASACINFVLIFLIPVCVYSRWWNLPVTILLFIGALLTTAGAVIATVLFIIFQKAITSATELNIRANIGVQMFVFMWIAAGAAIVAWLIHMGMCCCCATRRDVRTGRKRGDKKAWAGDAEHGEIGEEEKTRPAEEKRRLPVFGRTRRS